MGGFDRSISPDRRSSFWSTQTRLAPRYKPSRAISTNEGRFLFRCFVPRRPHPSVNGTATKAMQTPRFAFVFATSLMTPRPANSGKRFATKSSSTNG